MNHFHFYLVYKYIHLHPKKSLFQTTMFVSGLVTGVSYDYYRYHVLPIARRYALVISEIDWRKRLEWDNHHEFFPRRETIIIDTLPIRVCIPNDRLIARLLFQPKYKGCVFKVTLACTFKRKIVWFSSLSLGTMNDDRIAVAGLHGRRVYRYPWEWVLADGIYRTLPRCIIPFRKPWNRTLNATEIADNQCLADARARIEHVNAWVVYSHEMFYGRPFIGTFEDLHMYVTITVHTSATLIEMEPSRGEHMGRFNHPHFGGY